MERLRRWAADMSLGSLGHISAKSQIKIRQICSNALTDGGASGNRLGISNHIAVDSKVKNATQKEVLFRVVRIKVLCGDEDGMPKGVDINVQRFWRIVGLGDVLDGNVGVIVPNATYYKKN